MAADDRLAIRIPDSDYEAAVRFYRWEIPTVSLGCHQLPDAVNLDKCRELGWDVVWRSTGGRALLHDNDLSYSIVIPSEGDSYMLFHRLFERIGLAITDTLKTIDLDATISEPTAGYKRGEKPLRAGLCLDSQVRGEVTIRGRKIAAAAQHVYRNSLLQHGSIMIEGDPGAIASVSNLDDSEKSTMAQRLRSRACSLNELSSGKVEIESLVELLKINFSKYLGLDIYNDDWNDEEIDMISAKRADFEIYSHKLPAGRRPRLPVKSVLSGKNFADENVCQQINDGI